MYEFFSLGSSAPSRPMMPEISGSVSTWSRTCVKINPNKPRWVRKWPVSRISRNASCEVCFFHRPLVCLCLWRAFPFSASSFSSSCHSQLLFWSPIYHFQSYCRSSPPTWWFLLRNYWWSKRSWTEARVVAGTFQNKGRTNRSHNLVSNRSDHWRLKSYNLCRRTFKSVWKKFKI